jgi:hypothetical protein
VPVRSDTPTHDPLGVQHFLQGRFVANDQGGSLRLQQLLLLEIREQTADRLARRADHFRDFFMCQRHLHMRRLIRVTFIYANKAGQLFGKPFTFGITLNNNPGVEDLWNSTPAWGYPFVGSNVAPGPSARAIINGSLAQDVAGVGGYTMWNEHLYLTSTIYRSEHIGGAQPNAGTGFAHNIRGVAPYWRVAWQTSSKNNYWEVGGYGMHVKSTPNGITGLMDGYTDWAADFQYDRTIPRFKNDVLSVRGTYIRENSALLATFAAGGAAQTGHHLNTAQTNVEYHFGTRFSGTAGYFNITGTSDPLCFLPSCSFGKCQRISPKQRLHLERLLVARTKC